MVNVSNENYTEMSAPLLAVYSSFRQKVSGEKVMSDQPLKGKVAVVTGASRGLGRAMAISLAEAGASIACVGRNEEKLSETKALLDKLGVESDTFICDVRYEDQVNDLEKQVSKRFGPIHILVNNAGTNIPELFKDVKQTS
ncbi:MAG TPA: hypothetical protein DEO41_06305, partial [Betaproteobacteria bacterium]|nr:hypothetical protein [Betaproteobacteria bacterium]